MNILRVISSADPRGGGPIEGLKLSAAALSAMGHETEIVSLDDPTAAFLRDLPVIAHACGPKTLGGRYAADLIPWISGNAARFDAAVVHGLWNWASLGGSLALRRTGLPYVLFTHGMMDPWFKRQYPAKHMAKQAVWLSGQGQALRDAYRVLFTSEQERLSARNIFFGHRYLEEVVAYGCAEPPPHSCDQDDAFRARVPALKDRRYLLYLSRIHEKKGCDHLVEAFGQTAAADPDLDLVIAGPDVHGMTAGLQAIARQHGVGERIHFPGMLAGPAKWGAFHGAEAFILPSHQENFGIVVAEAMACGTPVLTTDKVNIWREVLASGGGLIEADTQAGASKLLRDWIALPASAKNAMRQCARQGYCQNFRIEQAAGQLLTALTAAAGTRDLSRRVR